MRWEFHDIEVRRRTLAKILAIVFVFNLVVMGAGVLYSYQQSPPIPDGIEGPDGETVVTESDVRAGKIAFQSDGLMNHGSILGNGAYFGVDYTADALELKVLYMWEFHAQERYDAEYGSLAPEEQASVERLAQLDLEASDGTQPEYTEAEAYAHEQVRQEYVERYHEGDRERGVPAGMVDSEAEARQVADFALWTAWISHTDRPGGENSYTNNWPYAPGAGNTPTGGTAVWSAISLILLVAAAGAGIWLYKSVSLPEPESPGFDVPGPDEIDVLPSQTATTWFIRVAAILFVAQTLLGGVLAHYYIERDAFYGIESIAGMDVLQWLPFTIAKTYHLDLGILWIAACWLAAGIFLSTLLTGREPRRQKTYVRVLLGAIFVVTVGGFTGVWLGTNGYIDPDSWYWWLVGNEGLEYLEVGRLWQFGLLAGFGFWAILVAAGSSRCWTANPGSGSRT